MLFRTGDRTLDNVLKECRTKFSDRSPLVRREALERLKSLADPSDKKRAVNSILDAVTSESSLRARLEAQATVANRSRYRAANCPETPWVFCTKGGERVYSVKSSWMEVVREAGLKDFHFHDLPHTCGSWLVQAGVPLFDVKEVLGHSTIRMTERYAHFAPENLRAAVDKLRGVPISVPLVNLLAREHR